MAKFNPATEMDKYANSGGYFSLKDDGDVATVRFMYNSVDDIEGYCVHKVPVNGFDRYVDCLRSYSDPLSACPLCEARFKTITKFFVPLYMVDTNEVVTWDRGQNFYSKLADLCGRCNPPVSYTVEIERNGKAGDKKTTYELYEQTNDGTLLEDLPEIPDPMGTIILEKTFDELVTYVNTGSFETGDDNPTNNNSANRSADNGVERRRRDVSAAAGVRRRGSGNRDVPL